MPQQQRQEDYSKRKEDGLELSGPYGLKAKFSGDKVVIIVILLAGFFTMVFFLRDSDKQQTERVMAIRGDIAQKMGAVADQVEEATWVLTLPEAERKALKLDMPYSMRKKLRREREQD